MELTSLELSSLAKMILIGQLIQMLSLSRSAYQPNEKWENNDQSICRFFVIFLNISLVRRF